MGTAEREGQQDLKVSARRELGKEAARKLRRQKLMPGIFYGARHEPVAIALHPEELLAALDTPKQRNTLLRLASDDAELNGRLALVKEIQRHPLSRALLHVDLMEVYADKRVRAEVPIHIIGHAPGVDMGGTLEQHVRALHVRCPADKIPAWLEVDVSSLAIGGHIKVKELPVGEEVEVLDDGNTSIVSVVAPTVAEEAKPAEGEEAAEVAAAEKAPAETKAEKKEKPEK